MVAPETPLAAADGPGSRQVTLITGDTVVLDGRGRAAGLLRAPGRERIPVQVREIGDATYVVPLDAQQLIAKGVVDRRLFNVTELSRAGYDAAHRVPIIVTYAEGVDAVGTRARLFADEGATNAAPEPTARLSSINGEALTVAAEDTAATWRAFTQPAAGAPASLTAAPGVATITLDAVVHAALDRSVPQIGAPQAWAAGYDGTGTTVAVLDTGITADHEDVSGKIVAARNFTESPSTGDSWGHGTHVASIAAGTGAHSGGTYTGVAPGAKLINAKVLGDDGGGYSSWIIEGMEWAVAQGADVVNLSLGGDDFPGIDPLEEAINTLSAESDSLFVAASGNDGPDASTVDSPGSADAALTVGAVDKRDQLADFSSVGPRQGDGAVKPDVTAPGVSIGAAAAPGSVVEGRGTPVADGYVAISGTSMATPHVAGAAAILAQAHPTWDGEDIKAALTGSARPNEKLTAHQQGTGRVDVPAALNQTVIAEPTSLNFGLTEWPHDDDQPITRELTYRNLGAADVTLDLAATGTGPHGGATPAGMFTVSQDQVTVPAGGTATVGVTADTTVPDLDGPFTVAITATSDAGQGVRTAGAVEREGEAHHLTVEAIDRNGQAPGTFNAMALNLETFQDYDLSPGVPARLPAGEYAIDANFYNFADNGWELRSQDWLAKPSLKLTGDTTLDARMAKPLNFSLEGVDAVADLNADWRIEAPDGTRHLDIACCSNSLPDGLNTAQLGAPPEGWSIRSHATAKWHPEGSNEEYHAFDLNEGGFYTGFTRQVERSELARVTTTLGASLPDRTAWTYVLDDQVGVAVPISYPAPSTVEIFVEGGATRWDIDVHQRSTGFILETRYNGGWKAYRAGKRYRETYNVGVFGPIVSATDGALFRKGNTIYGNVYPFSDGAGHAADSNYDKSTASTILYRDGKEFARAGDIIDRVEFEVPADKATYQLVTTANREGMVANASTAVTASYTFTSAAPADGETDVLPAAAVRYTPQLALDNTSPAGRTVWVPVTVQTSQYSQPGWRHAVTVEVSYDRGGTWQKTPCDADGAVEVTNPAAGSSVSFRATVKDARGNATTQTIIDAYRTA